MITLYGIPNCDTVRKARKWLSAHKVEFIFFDLRKDGLTSDLIKAWLTQLDWEQLVNKRGTTWRSLSEKQRNNLDQRRAVTLMLQNPTIIKRPVVDYEGKFLVGFDEKTYNHYFSGTDTEC